MKHFGMSKKILAVFLSLLMLVTVFPVSSMTAFAAGSRLVVNGKDIGDGGSVACSGGTATYSGGVLTLDNVTITEASTWRHPIETNIDNLTIKLVGTNTVSATKMPTGKLWVRAIEAENLKIVGDGTLNLSAKRDGFQCAAIYANSLVIGESAVVNITTQTSTVNTIGIDCEGGDVTITDSAKVNVDAKCKGVVEARGIYCPGKTVNVSKSAELTVKATASGELIYGVDARNFNISGDAKADIAAIDGSPSKSAGHGLYLTNSFSSSITDKGKLIVRGYDSPVRLEKLSLTDNIVLGDIKYDKEYDSFSDSNTARVSLNRFVNTVSYAEYKAVRIKATSAGETYTITYDANGGEDAPADQVVEKTANTNISSDVPTRTGYAFDHWNTAANDSGTSYASGVAYTAHEDLDLFAIWNARSYTIKFFSNGGEGNMAAQTVSSYNDSVTLDQKDASIVKTDSSFLGWSLDSSKTTADYEDKALLKDVVEDLDDQSVTTINLYAIWGAAGAKTITIKFDANGGDGEMADQVFNSTDTGNLNDKKFTRTGYTFSGWLLDKSHDTKDLSNKASFTKVMKKIGDATEVTLFANWTPITYIVQFDGNGKDSGDMSAQTLTYDKDESLTKNAFVKNGYEFAGWVTDKAITEAEFADEEEILNLASEQDTVIKLFALWKEKAPETKNITFKINVGVDDSDPYKAEWNDGTTGKKGIPFVIDSSLDDKYLPNGSESEYTFSRPGYTFNGWTWKDTDQNVIGKPATMPSRRIIAEANWTKKSVAKVVFDANTGSIVGEDGSGSELTFNSNGVAKVSDENLSFTITPNTGYKIKSVTLNDTPVSVTNDQVMTVDTTSSDFLFKSGQDRFMVKVAAEFELITYDLTINGAPNVIEGCGFKVSGVSVETDEAITATTYTAAPTEIGFGAKGEYNDIPYGSKVAFDVEIMTGYTMNTREVLLNGSEITDIKPMPADRTYHYEFVIEKDSTVDISVVDANEPTKDSKMEISYVDADVKEGDDPKVMTCNAISSDDLADVINDMADNDWQFSKNPLGIKITANDKGTGVLRVKYLVYISDEEKHLTTSEIEKGLKDVKKMDLSKADESTKRDGFNSYYHVVVSDEIDVDAMLETPSDYNVLIDEGVDLDELKDGIKYCTIYAKVVDAAGGTDGDAGNRIFLASDGIIIDDIAPEISGVASYGSTKTAGVNPCRNTDETMSDGSTYYYPVTITVTDDFLRSVEVGTDTIPAAICSGDTYIVDGTSTVIKIGKDVTVNGEVIPGFSEDGAFGTYTITAYDKAGNTTTFTFTYEQAESKITEVINRSGDVSYHGGKIDLTFKGTDLHDLTLKLLDERGKVIDTIVIPNDGENGDATYYPYGVRNATVTIPNSHDHHSKKYTVQVFSGEGKDAEKLWEKKIIDQKPVPDSLSVNPTELEFGAEGGSKKIDVSSNTSWSAKTSDSWITVSSDGTITVAENTTGKDRTGTVTITTKGDNSKTITITIKQSGSKSGNDDDDDDDNNGGKRIYGEDRTGTAAEISKNTFAKADNVVLASGDNFADALAGVPFAYALNAPILLVRNSELSRYTYNEIERLGAKNIYILGGENTISKQYENRLVELGYNVIRISGNSRYETAVEIAKRIEQLRGKPCEVFFAFAENYPDALAAGPAAAIEGAPILYMGKDGKLNDATGKYLASSGVKNSTILGGTNSIGAAAEGNIKAVTGTQPVRIGGADRYATNININNAYDKLFTGDAICIATGNNYPDALAGGVLAAVNKAPILLVDSNKVCINAAQEAYVAKKAPSKIFVFGGPNAVNNYIVNSVINAAK